MIVNRLAWIGLISVIFLVLAGATVRVTGSGLGCPDWPFCWGCWVPPTDAKQIDIASLDLEKFKKHATRKGIDPETITRETILESFNPVQTWIEYGNRLASLPLGLATLLLAFSSLLAKIPEARRKHRWWIIVLSWFCLLDVVANAIMGAMVVRSGLQPGIITLHMALAFLLIAVLTTVIWLTRPSHVETTNLHRSRKKLLWISLLFFACLFCEGLLGSQLREHTDELGIAADETDRRQWVEMLAPTLIYKVHRSFSWSLLLTSGLLYFFANRSTSVQSGEPRLILLMVVAMMVMGVVLAHIAIFQVVQVLHVGTTSVLLAVTWHWILRLFSNASEPEQD
ncbi:COX15/CtaA family protein [Pirellulaceae bacterium]|jgi:heme a synthase|nr:COX15/CtaA family protein [Mariniblastus sp.]MDB4756155.1 COX15/CtaA family protein [Mariniblastus sp.]MDB4794101.1 COX15/CtaA family protein [Pirellulaceae bacterium]